MSDEVLVRFIALTIKFDGPCQRCEVSASVCIYGKARGARFVSITRSP